jgi:hypothetical protein
MLRRLPQAHVDPISNPLDALLVILLTMDDEPQYETVVITLDAERCGHAILKITGTDDPDAVLGVVDMVAEVAESDPDAHGMIVASVRPDGRGLPSDVARWEELDRYCTDSGVELVEWFILGDSVSCPREFGGAVPRWQSWVG